MIDWQGHKAKAVEGGIILAAYPYEGGCNPYPIEWSQLNSRTKLLGTIHHLTEKTWFSADMCRDLIEVVAEHYHWGV